MISPVHSEDYTGTTNCHKLKYKQQVRHWMEWKIKACKILSNIPFTSSIINNDLLLDLEDDQPQIIGYTLIQIKILWTRVHYILATTRCFWTPMEKVLLKVYNPDNIPQVSFKKMQGQSNEYSMRWGKWLQRSKSRTMFLNDFKNKWIYNKYVRIGTIFNQMYKHKKIMK